MLLEDAPSGPFSFSIQLASESLQTARLGQRPSLTIQRKEPIDKGTTLS
jgi:hypothetical protein